MPHCRHDDPMSAGRSDGQVKSPSATGTPALVTTPIWSGTGASEHQRSTVCQAIPHDERTGLAIAERQGRTGHRWEPRPGARDRFGVRPRRRRRRHHQPQARRLRGAGRRGSAVDRPPGLRPRRPRRAVGRGRRPGRGGVRRGGLRRRARQQRGHVAPVPEPRRRRRGPVRQGPGGQPQGLVPAGCPRRGAHGRR